MHIAVIGTGYVGLVTGACFAEFGVFVTCVDKDKDKIESLKKGTIPFYEPGLEELVTRNFRQGRIKFTTDIGEAVEEALVVFIAVGTPPRGDGSADLSYVDQVGGEIACHLKGYKVIVTKSTVPVGTGEHLRKVISGNLKEAVDFDIVSNPEFLREGAAIEDFMRPNRVVLGANSQQAIAILKDLYRPLYLIETPFVIANIETAELIKYASNAFLATKISFINEIANLCENVGADVKLVAKGMGLDGRIGSKFLHAGAGFGGSCFPKDTRALLQIASASNVHLGIVDAAIRANERQIQLMSEKIKSAVPDISGKTIAVLGLSFKPNTDDIREAPALNIIQDLSDACAKIRTYDPVAMENARQAIALPDIAYCADAYDACSGADAVVIVTEWNQFRSLDLQRIKGLLRSPLFFDLRNIYEPEKMREAGFKYYCVGR
ncbi:MAG TPA: UDP-glucose/GDP-mannose dehydrogenase family protein [Dissulfurispiraceae bacterium]|nr:UDP-glucose/GDP-mannose dehydrogenase family protein [Dissulfurispiraceae bacterium]